YSSWTLSRGLNPTTALLFHPLANCYLKDFVPRVFQDARVFFCPEEGIKKTAKYGGWSLHEINHFIVIRIEVSGASRNIHLYNRYCDSPPNHYLNHPRTEEHLCGAFTTPE
ncbi:hypothetical protein ACR6E7_003920, partial [Escherichia coli]